MLFIDLDLIPANPDEKHAEFLSDADFIVPQKFKDQLGPENLVFLEKYGSYLRCLSRGLIEPVNESQRRFLAGQEVDDVAIQTLRLAIGVNDETGRVSRVRVFPTGDFVGYKKSKIRPIKFPEKSPWAL